MLNIDIKIHYFFNELKSMSSLNANAALTNTVLI